MTTTLLLVTQTMQIRLQIQQLIPERQSVSYDHVDNVKIEDLNTSNSNDGSRVYTILSSAALYNKPIFIF
jgi:hypothetical protein